MNSNISTKLKETSTAKRVHEGYKPFKCEIENCEYASKSRNEFNCHTLSIHEKNKKPFLCTECGMSFIAKGRLENHVGSVHEKKKDFQCELCSAGFACISYLLTWSYEKSS